MSGRRSWKQINFKLKEHLIWYIHSKRLAINMVCITCHENILILSLMATLKGLRGILLWCTHMFSAWDIMSPWGVLQVKSFQKLSLNIWEAKNEYLLFLGPHFCSVKPDTEHCSSQLKTWQLQSLTLWAGSRADTKSLNKWRECEWRLKTSSGYSCNNCCRQSGQDQS